MSTIMDHCDDDAEDSQSNSNSSPAITYPHSPLASAVTFDNPTSAGFDPSVDGQPQRQMQQSQLQYIDRSHNPPTFVHPHYTPHHHHHHSHPSYSHPHHFPHPRHVVSTNGLNTSPIRSSHPLLQLQQFMLRRWNLFKNELESPTTFPAAPNSSMTNTTRKPITANSPTFIADPASSSFSSHPHASVSAISQFRRHSDAAFDRQHGPMGGNSGSNYRRRGGSLISRQMPHHSSIDGHSWQRGQPIGGLNVGTPSKVFRRARPASQRSIVVNVYSGRNFGGMIDRPPSITSSDRSDDKPHSSCESSPRRTPTSTDSMPNRPRTESHLSAVTNKVELSSDVFLLDRGCIEDEKRQSADVPVKLQDESYQGLVGGQPIIQTKAATQSPELSPATSEAICADEASLYVVRSSTPVNLTLTTQTPSESTVNTKRHQSSSSMVGDSSNSFSAMNFTAPDQPISVCLPSSPDLNTQKSIDRADTPTTSELYWTPDPPASPSTGISATVRPSCMDEHDPTCEHVSPHTSTALVSACRPSLLIDSGSSIHPASVVPTRFECLNDID